MCGVMKKYNDNMIHILNFVTRLLIFFEELISDSLYKLFEDLIEAATRGVL